VIQPNDLVDDFGREAEAAIGIGRRAHAQEPATGADLSQLDSTVRGGRFEKIGRDRHARFGETLMADMNAGSAGRNTRPWEAFTERAA
jgi:hypothetical protein